MNNRTLNAIFGILGLILFAFLIREAASLEIVKGLKEINWQLFFVALGVYLLVNVVRSLRYFLLLEKSVPLRKLFFIVLVQNFFNTVLPLRAGEFSYVHLIHQTGVSFGKNVASLIASRLFDLISIIAITFVSLLFLPRGIVLPEGFLSGISLLLIIVLAFSFLAIFYGERMSRIIRRLSPSHSRGAEWFTKKIDEMIAGFALLRERNLLGKVSILSVLGWAGTFFSGFLLLKGIAPNLSPTTMIFVYAFPVVVSLTPFIGFGGFGSYEASVVLPLIMVGWALPVAIEAGVLLHIQELLFVIILGIIGIGGTYMKRKDSASAVS